MFQYFYEPVNRPPFYDILLQKIPIQFFFGQNFFNCHPIYKIIALLIRTNYKSPNSAKKIVCLQLNKIEDIWDDVVLPPSLNSFKSRLNKFWHGHTLKFTPSSYISGETVKIQVL